MAHVTLLTGRVANPTRRLPPLGLAGPTPRPFRPEPPRPRGVRWYGVVNRWAGNAGFGKLG